ncbi:hypothetical protein [Methylobacterium sp. Leaf466]|uniref:hypothetical protein n=1 Tax=Methylobacterium sp. Leaf466 TaxID=1736386 RepID=UPI000AA141BA|nr:hypothetical protein [Methylobacterium sp. Leaf466]
MADDTTPPRKAKRSYGYAPMSAEAWETRITYLRQALAKIKDPSTPEPDPALLAVGPHGPLTGMRVAPAPNNGPVSIYFTVQNSERGPRWSPPEVFLMLDLLLAFGGGASVNDAGNGWAYLRPWGGNDRHTLGRLVANPRPGQVVKQCKRSDHHDQHPQHFQATGGEGYDPAALGTPRRDREDAIATALGYWDRNHHRRPDIRVTRAEYEAVLRDCFRLVDAYYSEDPADADEA